MRNSFSHWLAWAIAGCLLMAQPVASADDSRSRLASVQWLEQALKRDDVVLLDASPAPLFAAQHIPGAVHVDLLSFGIGGVSVAEMERRMQSWGVSAGKKVVIYDQGAAMMATRIFFDLYYHGFPAADLLILDGGLSKWQAAGGIVTKAPTPAPARGSFRITRTVEDARARLPEFLVASGDPAKNALVEALDPSYHFGETKFFDRAGHVPNATMLPTGDFFNADKTFKSAEEIGRMVSYLGIKPEQQIHTYCGGGWAASVPFFAMKFMLNFPKVKLYSESQLEWLQDERGLPFWTYDAPSLKRDMQWLSGWSNRMLRAYGVTQISVLDVRPAEAFQQGHVPYALNIPAAEFRRHLGNPGKLAELLGPAGVNAGHEAVIVADGGLNEGSALAFLMLESLGQKKVSVLMDSVDEWGLRGLPLTKEATAVGAKKGPHDLSIPPTLYPHAARPGVLITNANATQGLYPKVFIASGKTAPARSPEGKVVHVPFADLLNTDGTPKAAKDIWSILAKAGVPRYAEIVCFADDPGAAAVNYFILRLMGYPDVKVLLT
jgi:thiosulfate/3-mercaptopyruvate sulfurtransferase